VATLFRVPFANESIILNIHIDVKIDSTKEKQNTTNSRTSRLAIIIIIIIIIKTFINESAY